MDNSKDAYFIYAIATIEFSGKVFADSLDEATSIFERCAESFSQQDPDAQIYNVQIKVVEKDS